MPELSVVIITLNEESRIRECLESVNFADEIVVVDSGSSDRTCEISREFTDKVFEHPFEGWVKQKNYAASLAKFDWVLNIDADERVSPELVESLERWKSSPEQGLKAGYEIAIRPYYLGRWIKHSNWYPGYKVRLYDRRQGRWEGDFSHEAVHLDDRPGRLDGDILHYSFRDFDDHLEKMRKYTSCSARELYDKGVRFSWMRLLGRPLFSFLKHYVWKRGVLDGFQGLVISIVSAFSVFAKYVKLRELERDGVRKR